MIHSGVQKLIKSALPHPLFRSAKFLKRLPIYYRIETSEYLKQKHDAGIDCIFLDDGIRLRLPDDALALNVFRYMAFEAQEWRSFLQLARGCRAFVDVGASGGFFSALFTASRKDAVRLLSVEPDPPSVAVLANVCERNRREGADWRIDRRAIGRTAGNIEFVSSGYGVARSFSAATDASTKRTAVKNAREFRRVTIECLPLQEICRQHGLVPDLLKIDVEGMEWDLVRASRDWLADVRPKMHLEIHPLLIPRHGGDPVQLLKMLSDIGYRAVNGDSWSKAFGQARKDAVFHLDLDGGN